MAKGPKSVTSRYLLEGALYALEQCGLLLRDAISLFRTGSYASAVVLGSFAREELGRAKILFGLRDKVLAGKTVTLKEIAESCEDHVTKQQWAVASTNMRVEDNGSRLAKLLQTKISAHPQSEDWKAADKELREIDEIKRKRASHERHEQRMRALYVEPDDFGRGWNRPRETATRNVAHDFLQDAANDYASRLQKIDPTLLKGEDDQLLQELTEWAERPELPLPQWPDGGGKA